MFLIFNHKKHQYLGLILSFNRYFTTCVLTGSDMNAFIIRYTREPHKHFVKVLILFKNLYTKYDFVKNMFVTFLTNALTVFLNPNF